MIQDTAPSERIIIIRPSLKKMCDANACRAAVLNHMLYWIAYKHKNGEDYWYATGEELYTQMDASWSINIIRREVKALIASGLIGEMHNPKWAADRTKHFFFGQDQAKAFFTACTENKTCPWCIGFPTVILHLLSTHLTDLLNANDKSVKCICQKHQMHLLNLLNGTNKSGTAITKESTKETTKNILRETSEENENSLVASAYAESDGKSTFLSSLSSFEETMQEVHNGQTPLDASPNSERHQQEEPLKPADTSVTPACTSAAYDTTHKEETLQESPTQVALLPAIQDAPTKPAPTRETHKKGKSKIPEPVPLCSSRIIREAIDALRGYSLDESGAIIHQNIVLKEWCQKHTLEDFQHVIDHLTTGHCSNEKHQWWRQKNRMGTYFNADKLAELTPGVLSELGHIPKPAAPSEIAPQEEPKIVTWTPVMRITPPKGVTVIYG